MRKWLEDCFLLSITVIGVVLYTYKLSLIPSAFHGDEAETALQALQLSNMKNLIGVGWFDIPLLAFSPHAITMVLFGQTIFGQRMASVLFGIATIPFFYLFVKTVFTKRLAAIATVLFATSHLWIALTRFGTIYSQTAFFLILTLLVFYKALQSQKKMYFLFAGILLGISFYSYYSIRILPLIMLPALIFYILDKRHYKQRILHIAILCIAAGIIFLPQAIFYFNHPEMFNSRAKMIYIFSETGEAWTQYNKSKPEILWLQFKSTINVFTGDHSTQYGYKGMILDYGTAFFLIVGIAYSIVRFSKISIMLFLWLAASILGQVLTTMPTSFFLPRFVVGLPVLYIFAALGIDAALKPIKIPARLFLYCIGSIVIFISLLNLYKYFIEYPKQVAGDVNARAATNMAYYLAQTPSHYSAIFITPYQGFSQFGPLRFLAQSHKKTDVFNPDIFSRSKETVLGISTDEDKDIIFFLYPQYSFFLTTLQNQYPHGKISEVKDIDEQIQFLIYKVEPKKEL